MAHRKATAFWDVFACICNSVECFQSVKVKGLPENKRPSAASAGGRWESTRLIQPHHISPYVRLGEVTPNLDLGSYSVASKSGCLHFHFNSFPYPLKSLLQMFRTFISVEPQPAVCHADVWKLSRNLQS